MSGGRRRGGSCWNAGHHCTLTDLLVHVDSWQRRRCSAAPVCVISKCVRPTSPLRLPHSAVSRISSRPSGAARIFVTGGGSEVWVYRGSRVRSPPVPVALSVYQRGSLLDDLAMYLSCDTKKFHDNESTHILHNFWTSTHRGKLPPFPPGGATKQARRQEMKWGYLFCKSGPFPHKMTRHWID